jgi:dihydroxy-acid dehydratase
MGLRELAAHVKRGVAAAGGVAFEFPTISISEAYVRPSSMYLRNLMSMDTEEMITTSPIDGVVLLGGCDKTLPAQLMGAASADKPALALGAGPRALSRWKGTEVTVEHLWPLIADRRAGRLGDSDWSELEGCLSCGVGTCNVMGTAVTMAVVAETLGMALPGTSLLPSTSARRATAAEETGVAIVERVRADLTPTRVITKDAIANAFRVMCAVGGSTNALLHLQAVAGRLGRQLSVEELRTISASTPLVVDVRPSGEGFLHDFEADGGVPALMHRLAGLANMGALSGNGKQWIDTCVDTKPVRDCIKTVDEPAGPPNSLTILVGSLAPSGALLKRAAATPQLCQHRGRAVVFDSVADMNARIDSADLEVDGSSVLVLRNAGPIGGPGMPEVGHIPIPKKLLKCGVIDMVRISDARMSGTASGTVVLHVTPEASFGGPLGLVRDGDWIVLDVENMRLDLEIALSELDTRRAELGKTPTAARGYAALYQRHVLQADSGCDFDFLRYQTSDGTASA